MAPLLPDLRKGMECHSLLFAYAVQISSPWEEVIPILVKGNSHDSVAGQERLLNAIAMVDVNVNIQHPVMVLEQLQNRQNYVIHVAEAGSLHSKCL